jgi:general secretion pathway protein D
LACSQSEAIASETEQSVSSSTSSVQSPFVSDVLEKQGSVVFRDTPLAEVILILSEQWDINIIAGSEISGQVSGTFKHESLKSILNSMLTANGLVYQQIGNSLVVMPSAEASGSRSNFQVEVISLPPADPAELEDLLSALKLQMSPDGQLVPIKSSNKLTIQDTPDRIAAVKRLLEQIVAPVNSSGERGSVYVSTNADGLSDPTESLLPFPPVDPATPLGALELRPQYIAAKDLLAPLTMLAGDANLSIVEEENVIVVFGDKALQQKARLLLQQIDKPRQQVRITGYIYDVDLGEIERLGVDWNQRVMSTAVDANGVPRNLNYGGAGLLTPTAASNPASTIAGVVEDTATATAGAATTAAGPSGGQFLFRTLNSHSELQMLVQALDQTEGSRLLADPHVTVVDRHKASLGIVTEIPVQQLTQTQQGGSIGTTTFRDAGITLDVTPRIAGDGTIEMTVEPTFSVLSGFQGGNPIIDTRRASTVVRVAHGQALVIGGLRSKTTVETVKGIPGLMNIKFLGALFRAHDTDVKESEMIVFIMPEIVGYCGGLDREMHALEVERAQLSRIQTAVDGPFTPDCHDCHCPQHHERPRIHNGMHDVGLVGNHDIIFVDPSLPLLYQDNDMGEPTAPSGLQPQFPAESSPPRPAPSSTQKLPTTGASWRANSSGRIPAKPSSYRR